MRIISWNVNGLRAIYRHGFMRWLNRCEADIVALQEVRARREQVHSELARARGWFTHMTVAERKGYSGVGLFARSDPDQIITQLGDPGFDPEARLQISRFGDLTIANAYFPNGNGKDRDNSRIPYKLAFFEAVFDHLEPARARGDQILVMGDFNTSPAAIDLARPKQNLKTSGFTPPEVAHLNAILARGWTDTFRHLHPDESGHYSWWSQRKGVREKSIGWRLDLILASPGVMPRLQDAFILANIRGSDHCPVGVDIA